MFTTPLILLALSASVFASLYVCFILLLLFSDLEFSVCHPQTTEPVAITILTGGVTATLTWQDDGLIPSLAQFGPAAVGIFAGNALQQVSYIIGLWKIAPRGCSGRAGAAFE